MKETYEGKHILPILSRHMKTLSALLDVCERNPSASDVDSLPIGPVMCFFVVSLTKLLHVCARYRPQDIGTEIYTGKHLLLSSQFNASSRHWPIVHYRVKGHNYRVCGAQRGACWSLPVIHLVDNYQSHNTGGNASYGGKLQNIRLSGAFWMDKSNFIA